MNSDTQSKVTKRLARIEGQVRGISKMVEDDRYCIDIVRQVQAIKSALSSVEAVILDDHLDSCVQTALQSEEIRDRREKVDELVAILGGRKK